MISNGEVPGISDYRIPIRALMKKSVKYQLKMGFPSFREPRLLDELIQLSRLKELRSGEELNSLGKGYKVLPLVLSGTIKIFKDQMNAAQKDLLLYYIQEGQSCAFSIHAILKNQSTAIRAVAETNCTLLILPQNLVVSLSDRYESFQKFLLNTLASRLNEVTTLIERIAFSSMEDRIRNYLAQKSSLTSQRILPISHQQIADELATSREVVSRILKQIEKKGEIELSRGRITLLRSSQQ